MGPSSYLRLLRFVITEPDAQKSAAVLRVSHQPVVQNLMLELNESREKYPYSDSKIEAVRLRV